MADGKYGRLFTEMDLKLVATEAAVELLRRLNRVGAPTYGTPPTKGELEAIVEQAISNEDTDEALTFPPDEPLFLLRGQDCSAPDAIAPLDGLLPETCRWDYWLSAKDDGADPEFLAAVQDAATAMRNWQRANPDRVGVPD